jgi:YidC/Oxa1 family membrane protein insertase
MDSKRLVIAVALSMAVFFGWFAITSYVHRQWGHELNKPLETAKAPEAPTTQPAPGVASTQPGSTQPAAPTPTTPTALTGGFEVIAEAGAAAPATVNLGSATLKDPQYAMLLRTVPTGAGVESVVLNDFLKSVKDPTREPYSFQHADPIVLQQYGNPLATRTITVDGTAVDVSRATWAVRHQDTNRVTYALTLGRGGRPELTVLKTYRVFERKSTENAGLGYEVRLDYDFDNHSGRPLAVRLAYNGPAMPPRELDAGPDQRVMAGYPETPSISVENHYIEYLVDEDQTMELATKDNKPMFWAGGSSVYFQGILLPPLQPDGKTTSTRSFKAIGLDPARKDHQPVALTVETADLAVAPNHTFNYPIHVFLGPKHRNVLNVPYYAQRPRGFDQTLVVRAGPCAVCTFDWLINLLVAMLGAFHLVARDWGLAIICLVVLVRLALHPITKRSQVSMMKMSKMGPEMKRLQEKYKDDKAELQKAMWEFQKQQGITPILGCLPMFLQMPIWIALWSALNTTFELRHSKFLWGLTWIDDLAKPDRLIPFSAGWGFRIPLIGTIVDAVNVLPILLAVVFYLQQKYTPKPATMTPEQAQQQKIMMWMMVLLFPLFLYGQPSGLNLYILTSTAIGIWESKRIRAHIKEKEEQEKAGLVLVDAEPSSPTTRDNGKLKGPGKGGKGGTGNSGAAQQAPQGWLARKLAELQEKAEQAKRQAENRAPRRKG